MRLTDLAIQRLPVPARGQKTYFEGQGFGVRVSCGGSKTFVVVYGKDRRLQSLGRYPAVSLKAARQDAQKFLATLSPHTKLDKSLAEAREAFLEQSALRNRPATTANYKLFLNRLTKTKLADVTKDDLGHGAHSIMAGKVFLNYCLRQGWVDRNPFAHERVTYGQRSRVLGDDEVKLVWAYDDPPFSDHLKLLLLTGQRRKQFSDYDVRGDTIFFPARIMKGKSDHIIPLLPEAKAIFARLQPFNSWSKAKARLDEQVKMPHWTIHDLRRTFATIMARLGTPIHVTEKILAHRSGTISGVTAIYNRHTYEAEAREALGNLEAHLVAVLGLRSNT